MVLYFEYDKIGEHFNLLKQDFFKIPPLTFLEFDKQ